MVPRKPKLDLNIPGLNFFKWETKEMRQNLLNEIGVVERKELVSDNQETEYF